MLETETKRFEDLEFQQLERESRQDEERETHTQQLLREVADNQRSTVTRKVPAILWVVFRFTKQNNSMRCVPFMLCSLELNLFKMVLKACKQLKMISLKRNGSSKSGGWVHMHHR